MTMLVRTDRAKAGAALSGAGIFLIVLATMLFLVGQSPAGAGTQQQFITFCHANPPNGPAPSYQRLTIADDGAGAPVGHDPGLHTFDIIPGRASAALGGQVATQEDVDEFCPESSPSTTTSSTTSSSTSSTTSSTSTTSTSTTSTSEPTTSTSTSTTSTSTTSTSTTSTTVGGPGEPTSTSTTVGGPEEPTTTKGETTTTEVAGPEELPNTGGGSLLALLTGGLGMVLLGSGLMVIGSERRRMLAA